MAVNVAKIKMTIIHYTCLFLESTF